MKIWFVAVPLWLLAGVAGADDMTQATEAVAAQSAPASTAKGAVKRRQGADMRHCLDLKDNRSIIRCAEPGRKP